MSPNSGAPKPRRAPLPTLTEDDMREQGERSTLPPPVPIGELVSKMMDDLDGDLPPGRGSAPAELVLDEVSSSDAAGILTEIGGAYLARLGEMTHVPFPLITKEAAVGVHLDHWAGFVLSLVDGTASIEDIVDASALPEFEALRLLSELRERGLIDVRPGR